MESLDNRFTSQVDFKYIYIYIERERERGSIYLEKRGSQSSSLTWLIFITSFVTRLTQWVPLVEQELLTLPEHLSSPPVFSGVRVTRSLVLCVMFCRSLFVRLSFLAHLTKGSCELLPSLGVRL